LRSDFWNPGRFLAPEDLPSNGQMACAMSGGAIDAETYDAERKERYAKREGFY
jgi:hypothetical protein